MTDSDTPLAFEEAFELLGPALPGDEIVLVGGQAVNFWLSYYRERDPSLVNLGVVTSDDVDFFGMSDAAARMASAIAGSTLKTASFDDAGPNTAVVTFPDRSGKERIIDFLHTVHGIKNDKHIRRTAVPVELKDQNGDPTDIILYILHPVLCLVSRVNNTHTFARYQTPRAQRQLRAAIACAKGFLSELCDAGQIREAHRSIRIIGTLARGPAASGVYQRFGLDVFDAIPLHPALGSDCLEKNIPLLRRKAGRD